MTEPPSEQTITPSITDIVTPCSTSKAADSECPIESGKMEVEETGSVTDLCLRCETSEDSMDTFASSDHFQCSGENSKVASDMTEAQHDDSVVQDIPDTESERSYTASTSSKTTPPSSIASGTSSRPHRVPTRTGMKWVKGEKIEAMDFMEKWYVAKIIDIDEEELMILIHFEGWNQRYDEWVEMKSERLRPLARHSDRKEHRKKIKTEFKLGQHVLAKWTDCRLYPAKVTGILQNGYFEVQFYDGFKRKIAPISIKPLPSDCKPQKLQVSPPLDPAQKQRTPTSSISDKKTPTPDSKEKLKHQVENYNREKESKRKRDRRRDRSMSSKKVERKRAIVRKRKKLIVAGAFFAKREMEKSLEEQEAGPSVIKMRKPFIHKDKVISSIRSPSRMKLTQRRRVPDPRRVKKVLLKPPDSVKQETDINEDSQLEITSGSGISNTASSSEIVLNIQQTDEPPLVPDIKDTPKLEVTQSTAKPASDKLKEKKPMKRLSLPVPSVLETSSLTTVPEPTKKRRSTDPLERKHIAFTNVMPPKAFVVEADHNPYKCMYPDCNKSFRKDNLLEYHIKYYHSDDGKPPPPPSASSSSTPSVSRKRKKTVSTCSTDSDASTTTKPVKSKARRRSRHKSLDVVSSETPIKIEEKEIKLEPQIDDTLYGNEKSNERLSLESHNVETLIEDIVETEESGVAEVVNCICGLNEEDGMMIQCDVCLCWQHSACFAITSEALPTKHMCYVCQSPPGVRDSARYIYDQEWLKEGKLAHFDFVPVPDAERKCQSLVATNSLISDIHNIHGVLSGLKQQIKISKDKEHSEFQLWQKDWNDNKQDTSAVSMATDVSIISVQETEPVEVPLVSETMETVPETDVKNDSHPSVSGPVDIMPDNNKPNIPVMSSELSYHEELCENVVHDTSEHNIGSDLENSQNSVLSLDRERSQNSDSSETITASSIPSMDQSISEQEFSAMDIMDVHDVPLEETDSFEIENVEVSLENPFRHCEKNLLHHIAKVQEEVDKKLDFIEEQIIALEDEEDEDKPPSSRDVFSDIPALKKSLKVISNDLVKIQRLAMYH